MSAAQEAVDALVGRDQERQEIARALAAGVAGQGRLLLLSGESGVGKTALLEVAIAEAEALGMLALRGSCWSPVGAPPSWPWTQIFRAALARAPQGWPPAPDQLVALIPELAAPGQPTTVPTEGPERFQLYDAARGALVALARSQPVLLVLDELDLAAPTTLEFLHLFSQELRTVPAVAIGAFRPLRIRSDARVDRLLAALTRQAILLPLGGLDERETAALLACSGATPGAALVRQVHRATAGNPQLLTELAVGLGGQTEANPADGLPLPEGLRRAVRSRLEPLDLLARTLLGPMAVLGPEIDVNRLRPLVGVDRSSLLDVLGEIISADIIVEVPDRPGRFRFPQPIVQQVVLAELSPAERAELHLRAAALIEERHAHDLDPHLATLARHYVAGGPEDVRRAIAVCAGAARRAAGTLELDQAAELWLLALDLAERGGVTRVERCDLLLALGDVQDRSGDSTAARRTLLEAAEVARAAADFARFTRAVLGSGGNAAVPTAGIVDGALVDLLNEALEHVGEDDPAIRSALLGRLAMERYYVDPRPVRDRLTKEAVALAERSADRSVLGRALNARHYALWSVDDIEERLVSATEILTVARQANDTELALQARTWRIVAYLEHGDGAALDREIAVHARLADAATRPLQRWNARVFQAMRALLDGRYAEAERLADAALELGVRLDANVRDTSMGPNARMTHGIQLFSIRREQHRLAELAPSIDHLAKTFPHLPVWRCAYALLLLQSGRLDEAGAVLAGFARTGFRILPRDGNWLIAMTLLSEVAVGLGDGETARVLHGLLRPYAGRVVVVGQAASCREAVSHHLGMLEATAGDHEAAVGHLEHALAMHHALGARPAGVRTRLALAASMATLGRHEPRTALLREAHAVATELGMAPAATQAERALAEAGADTRRPSGSPALAPEDPPFQPAARPFAHLRYEGNRWIVIFDGRSSQLRDGKGLRYLAALLDEPGVDHPAATLERRAVLGGDKERVSARERFDELRAELASAEAAGDLGQTEAVRDRMAALADELTGAGSSDRSEQARVNVTRAIRTALRNVAAADPALAAHLELTVKTGASCAYRPDTRAPIRWLVTFESELAP